MSSIILKEKDEIVFICPYCNRPAKDKCLFTDGDTVFGVFEDLNMNWNDKKDMSDEPWTWDMLSCPSCIHGCPDAMYLRATLMSKKFKGWDCAARLCYNVYYGVGKSFEAIPDPTLVENVRRASGVTLSAWNFVEYTDKLAPLDPMQEHFFGPFRLDSPIKGPYGVCACVGTDASTFARNFLTTIFPYLAEFAEERQRLWENMQCQSIG